MDHLAQVFLEEASELLSELETSLLELDKNPDDNELIDRVFRAMHTIKGSSALVGFNDVAEFTHEYETVLECVRNGEIPVSKSLINIALLARDHISLMLDQTKEGEKVDPEASQKIILSLKQIMAEAGANTPAGGAEEAQSQGPAAQAPSESEKVNRNVSYWVRFRPSRDLFMTGTNPVNLLNELRDLGDCEIVAQSDEIPSLQELNPVECYTYWDIIVTTDRGANAINDVFIFVEDESEIRIKVIDEEGLLATDEQYKRLGEILVDRGDLKADDLEKTLGKQKRLGEMLVDDGLVDAGKVQSALTTQQHVEQKRKERKKAESITGIRVASAKLDVLVDLVGELVTVQSRLSQMAGAQSDSDLLAISEEVERLVSELRDNAMSIRMLPIGTTFGKFNRLVRDLSNNLGKKIEMVTEGAETELDKTVIERLNDPLVHLIRNSIDHGIEAPEVRKNAGKPEVGTIHLSAVHSGASVLIKIADDGPGLNADAIRTKALEKGLIKDDSELSDQEVFALILNPGFSTAKQVTSVSGRGVGMDVVKRAIETLGGTIDISSQKGKGTTITLKLPLTLAIIEGLRVKVEGADFVLPLSAVEECVELSRDDIANAHGRKLANVRGEIVPYIHLREHFSVSGDSPDIEQIVIAAIEGKRVGFVVDEVIGEHQTVIKSLGKVFKDIKDVSGATILGDGSVALILDFTKLVEGSELEEMRRLDGPQAFQNSEFSDARVQELVS